MGIKMSCCIVEKTDARTEITNLNSLPVIPSETTTSSNVIMESDKILNNIKKINDPFESYSLALFQRLNDFRKEPFKFYAESKQNNLSNMWEEIIKIENSLTQVAWSQKKANVIKDIMKEDNIEIKQRLKNVKEQFINNFTITIFYSSGNFIVIDQAIWDVLKRYSINYKQKAFKFLTENYDYCVIYSTNKKYNEFENIGKYTNDGYLKYKKNSISSDEVTSFFFFFKYNK